MNIAVATADPDPNTVEVPEAFWRSLGHLNSFRVFLAIALGAAGMVADQTFHQIGRASCRERV